MGKIGNIETAETKAKISKSMKNKHNNPDYVSYRQEPKRVRCVELGCVFDSLYKAAKVIKTTSANITHVLKGRQQTAGGYHWSYEE